MISKKRMTSKKAKQATKACMYYKHDLVCQNNCFVTEVVFNLNTAITYFWKYGMQACAGEASVMAKQN